MFSQGTVPPSANSGPSIAKVRAELPRNRCALNANKAPASNPNAHPSAAMPPPYPPQLSLARNSSYVKLLTCR